MTIGGLKQALFVIVSNQVWELAAILYDAAIYNSSFKKQIFYGIDSQINKCVVAFVYIQAHLFLLWETLNIQ